MKMKRLWETRKGDRLRFRGGPLYGREAEVRDTGDSGFGSVLVWIAGVGTLLMFGEDLQLKVEVIDGE